MCVCVCVWHFCPRLKRAEKDLWLFTRVSLRLAFQSVGNRIVHSEHRSRETVQPSTPLDFLGESPFSVSLPLSHTHTRRWHAYWPQSCVCSLNSDGMLIYRARRARVCRLASWLFTGHCVSVHTMQLWKRNKAFPLSAQLKYGDT